MTRAAPPIRLIAFLMLSGVVVFGVLVAVLLASHEGEGGFTEPVPMFDWIAVIAGATLGLAALAMRGVLRRLADRVVEQDRQLVEFRAGLVPMAMVEGGILINLVAWLVNGSTMPNAVVATLLFAQAIKMIPPAPARS